MLSRETVRFHGGFWRAHYGKHNGALRTLHVHHKLRTSLCRHSGLTTLRTTLSSSWKSMEKSDGCQEKTTFQRI